MMQFRVCQIESGGLIMVLDGCLNHETVPKVRRHLLKTASRCKGDIVIDLSSVTSMDTSGVAVLVECLRCRCQKDGELRLTGVDENVRRVIHLARLGDIFGLTCVTDSVQAGS
jgi:anti-sigma B factor antagonist